MFANPLAPVMVLSLAWAAPAPAPVKDPAELLPANTLAYAEVRQPGQLVKEFASLFEGSALANVPDSLAKLLPPGEKAPRQGFGPIGGFGLLFAPEVVKEAKRLQGAAIALTGFKDGQPEWLAVVLPGESNAPAFLMRTILSTAPAVPAGEVEGVRLYRVILGFGGDRGKPRTGPATRPPGLKPAQQKREFLAPPPFRGEVLYGPTLALTPNALFIGSTDAVKDAIHRAKGNGKGASLASNKNFRETRKEIGNHPGLFAYAEPAPLVEVFEKALTGNKGRGPGIGRQEVAALAAFHEIVNLKAFRTVAYSLTLDKGTLRLSKLVLLNPEEKSPLLEVFPSQPVKTTLFQFTPSHPVLAVALSNDHGQERWTKVVKLLDAIAKLGGNRGKMPSEGIAEVEKALGIDFGKDVFGKITAASIALGNPLDAFMQGGDKIGPGVRVSGPPLVFVLQTGSAEDAKGLIELAPKIFALASHKQVEPVVKDIEGRKISILGGEGGLCYGRQGSTIVFGPLAKPVAQALANGAKKTGWLSDPKLAARLEKGEAPVMVAVARPFTLLMGFTLAMGRVETRTFEKVAPKIAPPDRKTPPPPPGLRKPTALPQARAVAPGDEARRKQERAEEARRMKEMAKLLEKEGLLIVRVIRKPDRILAETTLTDLKPMVGRLVDFGLMYFLSARPSAKPEFYPRPFDPTAPSRPGPKVEPSRRPKFEPKPPEATPKPRPK